MFTTVIGWFTGKLSAIIPWLLVAIAFAGSIFTANQMGKSTEDNKVAQANLKKTQEALNVQTNTANLSDTDVSNKLREFYRD